jgi:universal stress protein A
LVGAVEPRLPASRFTGPGEGAQLVVLYVVPLAAVMYGPPPESYVGHLREELCRLKPSDPETRVRHLLAEGDPAAAILKAARENGCELIVMGTHGRTGLSRLLMGSVAEEVVRKAPCLVLTVNSAVPAGLLGQATALGRLRWDETEGTG